MDKLDRIFQLDATFGDVKPRLPSMSCDRLWNVLARPCIDYLLSCETILMRPLRWHDAGGYQALPELYANPPTIARIALQNEGWERDWSLTEHTARFKSKLLL